MPPASQAGSLPISTIQESFRQKLPSIPDSYNETYRATHAPAQSTQQHDPPKAFIVENSASLINLGMNKLSLISTSSIVQKRLPQLEKTHHHSTEADILRTSTLYLLHPVNVAATRLISNGRLYCTSEQSSTGGIRTDIRWVYQSSQGQTTNVAVLELKNTRVLHWSDYSSAQTTQQNARAKVVAAYSRPPDYTHLIRNAIPISQQAIKYSLGGTVPDVAVFDWNALFVWNFAGMDESGNNPTLAKGIWFSEANAQASQGATFRTVLLGFLVRALIRHNISIIT